MPPAPGALQRISLLPHPSLQAGPVTRLTVDLEATAAGILLVYTLDAAVARLRIPPRADPGAADRLWAHTCCEAFVGVPSAAGYREFNFSPSGQWAVYDFADYRVPSGVPAARLDIDCTHDAERLVLSVRLPHAILPSAGDGALVVGLACVVEDSDGALAYWAVTHPADRPDFHHRDGFALGIALPPAATT